MDIFDYFESLRRSIQQNRTIGFLEEPALLAYGGLITSLAHAERTIWTGDVMVPVLITGAMEYDLIGVRA